MVGERKRAALVGALRCVDRVFLYDEVTAGRQIRFLRPQVCATAREHLRIPPRSAAEVDHLRAHLPQQLGLPCSSRRSSCQITSTRSDTSLTRSVLVHSCQPVSTCFSTSGLYDQGMGGGSPGMNRYGDSE